MKKMLKKISVLLILAMIVGIFQTGEVFAKAKYDEVGSFSEGLARVEKDGKDGFINKKGEEVVKVGKYDKVEYFNEGMACVEKDGKWGFINKKGEEIAKVGKYDDVSDFSKGMARVEKGGKWGFINKKGEEVVKPEYDGVGDFRLFTKR